MKSSLHSLIHFWLFLLTHLRLPSPELDTILDNSNDLLCPFITPWQGPRRKQPLLFTDPLPNNGRHIVARVCLSGNVFIESLPINGYTRHSNKNIKYLSLIR
jgi:hypothetical protein